ncbi:MAG: VWA domain-containing protein [Eubacterium sp.]|nr:VWA domain-containing protein [Eubacterium sp.]
MLELVAAVTEEGIRLLRNEQNGKKSLQNAVFYSDTDRRPEPFGGIAAHATLTSVLRSDRDPSSDFRREDLRYKRPHSTIRTDFLFVLDTSRSAGFHKRLSFAKSAAIALLGAAYSSRSRVGVLCFGDRRAEVVLSFTTQVEEAAVVFEKQYAAGNTPLAAALRRTEKIIEEHRRKNPDRLPVVILLTDGKANFDELPGDPMKNALSAAEHIAKDGILSIVVDTDTGAFSFGLARELARRMNAVYTQMQV